MSIHIRRMLHRSIFALLVCFSLSLIPSSAMAAFTPCRGDPIVDLTYHRIQSVVEVYTDLANIDRVDYIYRVPLGKTLPVMFDSSPLSAKEHATFVSNNGSGIIQIDTIVYLKPGVAPVQVTAITTVFSKVTGASITKSVTGMSGQVLTVTNQR